MAIKSYRKSNNYSSVLADEKSSLSINVLEKEKVTLWILLGNAYRSLQGLVASSNASGLIIPILFILAGSTFLYIQFQPNINKFVLNNFAVLGIGTTQLVPDTYIPAKEAIISNPSNNYFSDLIANAAILQAVEDVVSQKYNGSMYITIPRIGINKMRVSANVDSSSPEVYKKVLTSTLAHFKGTSLPISNLATNTVIYGHSVGGSYRPSANDPVSAFTLLSRLQVGDEIKVEVDGKEYKYRMSRSKIVQPEDIEIINGTPGRQTLTLLTCWPPGENDQRQVIIAQKV